MSNLFHFLPIHMHIWLDCKWVNWHLYIYISLLKSASWVSNRNLGFSQICLYSCMDTFSHYILPKVYQEEKLNPNYFNWVVKRYGDNTVVINLQVFYYYLIKNHGATGLYYARHPLNRAKKVLNLPVRQQHRFL